MEVKQATLKLSKEEKTIKAIAFGIANTTIWNELKKEKRAGLQTTRHPTG